MNFKNSVYRIDNIRSLDQVKLFAELLGHSVNTEAQYLSPFRQDTKPGCRFEWHSGVLYFVDNAGFEDRTHFNVVHAYAYINGIAYREAYDILNKMEKTCTPNISEKKDRVIKFKVAKNLQDPDPLFMLSPEILKKERVYPITEFLFTDRKGEVHIFKENGYAYVQTEHRIQLYLPHRTEKRFLTNMRTELYYDDDVDINEPVIITKSRKDMLTLKYHFGVQAVAVMSEAIQELPQPFLRFKHPFILFDNDQTGFEYSRKLSKKHNIPAIYPCPGCKDAFDMFTKNDLLFNKKFINECLKSEPTKM